MQTRSALVSMLALLALSAPARAAGPDETHACVTASDEGQRLRDDHRLLAALERFVACARDACPAPVRAACARWHEAADARVPSLVFGARDATGHDLVRVRVLVDGARVTDALNGAAVPVDPGPHAVRFEGDAGVVEETVVAREGEKDRVVAVTFPPAPPEPQAEPARASDAARDPRARASAAPIPAVAWVLGGVAVVGAGGFGYFGLTGQSDKNRLASTCAPSGACGDGEVSAARTELVVADVLLGVAVVSLAAAAYFVLTSRAPSAPAHARAAWPLRF